MNRFRIFLLCFVVCTTGILMICTFAFYNSPDALTPATLWQILLAAALCSLATTTFFPGENAGKVRVWAGIVLHFISLCAIMLLCGYWFGWVTDPWEAVMMVFYVILVYGFTTGVSYFLLKKQTGTMNQKLKEKYPNSETP